jgi:hypothetical protein
MIQTLLPPTAKRDRAYFSATWLRLTLSLLMLETWAVRLHKGGSPRNKQAPNHLRDSLIANSNK